LNVPQSGADLRVFDSEDLGAFTSDDSLWRNPLGYFGTRFPIDQTVQQSGCLVGHSLKIVADARERDLDAVTNDRTIDHAENRHIIRDTN
jgi:hypothetical protein